MTEEQATDLISALNQIAHNLELIEELLDSKLGSIDTGVSKIGQTLLSF